jgi:purine/pyrimidine-nucleoside phosphorylase
MATPEQLDNVDVKLKANVYFDGGVISHTVLSKDGRRRTIGVIRPGTYTFTTDAPERMDVIAGNCSVRQVNEASWKSYSAGGMFKIPGKLSFEIRVESGLAEYLCTFEA